jgi:phage-related holin
MWIQTLLWIIIGLIALDVLAGLVKAIVKRSFSFTKLSSFLKSDILTNIFPLFLLEQFTHKDPTHWLLAVMFYVAALGLVVKYVKDIINKFA